jgi:YebC/PmpR family DNA-binding regulatory protein
MSGHSKWATVKHKKTIMDVKRGKVFTKIIREIMIASKKGGSKVENNPRLRKAINDAKEANMPRENIKKALQKSNEEMPGVIYEEIVYEGYAPHGVALIVEAMTDNKNRTASDLRKIFSKYGGNLGEVGSVIWMFDRKGCISVAKSSIDEETLMAIALESDIEDFKSESSSDEYKLVVFPSQLYAIKSVLEKKNIHVVLAEIVMTPKIQVTVDSNVVKCILKLMDTLEGHDDVKSVYANFEISGEDVDKLNDSNFLGLLG